jgi:pseudouridine-5'-phosphate glycosidase/pseudouridine kinase
MSVNRQGGEISPSNSAANPTSHVDMLVFGSLASDLMCDYNPLVHSKDSASPALYTSNPATITQSAGGVGYNVALAAKYAGASVSVPPMTSESRIVDRVLGGIKGLRT